MLATKSINITDRDQQRRQGAQHEDTETTTWLERVTHRDVGDFLWDPEAKLLDLECGREPKMQNHVHHFIQ